jgi:hypothetical protein
MLPAGTGSIVMQIRLEFFTKRLDKNAVSWYNKTIVKGRLLSGVYQNCRQEM